MIGQKNLLIIWHTSTRKKKQKFAGAADFHIDRKEWEVRDQDGTFVEWHVQATAVGYP